MRYEKSGGWNMEGLTGVIYITEATYARLKGQTLFTTDERELGFEEDEIAFCRIMSTVRNFGEAPETLTIHGKEYRVSFLSEF